MIIICILAINRSYRDNDLHPIINVHFRANMTSREPNSSNFKKKSLKYCVDLRALLWLIERHDKPEKKNREKERGRGFLQYIA